MMIFYFLDELLIFAVPQRNTASNSAEHCVKPKTELNFGITSQSIRSFYASLLWSTFKKEERQSSSITSILLSGRPRNRSASS